MIPWDQTPNNAFYSHPLRAGFHEAKVADAPTATVLGTGTARREFLSSDDLADACVFVMKHYSDIGFLNVGTGKDITIAEFAEAVRKTVGYSGSIIFDTSRPDGAPQRLLDVSKINSLGWTPKISLSEDLAAAYADYLQGGRQTS